MAGPNKENLAPGPTLVVYDLVNIGFTIQRSNDLQNLSEAIIQIQSV